MGTAEQTRVAIVLFNLGGPDRLEAVEPFLFNLFNDPAIVDLPRLPRRILARVIARRRAATAREIYAKIDGSSPLLRNTRLQADALQRALGDVGEMRVFCCMRYWHPMSYEVAAAVKDFAPTQIVLLPLYPQFSTTTTGSSYKAWMEAAKETGIQAPARLVCCYPREPGLIEAAADLVRKGIGDAKAKGAPERVLFSAHGLPKKIVARGDPYVRQVHWTAEAIAERLGPAMRDWRVCFQSRVGPLEWVRPYTDEEIRRAGAERTSVVLFPIAFVSEHSETLVELDVDYRQIAEETGVPTYVRVATVGTAAAFIDGLARMVRTTVGENSTKRSGAGRRICTAEDAECPLGSVVKGRA